MRLKGSIFKYDAINNLIAFSNNTKSKITIILIGGLDHNLLSLPYTYNLYKFCKKYKLELIIPQFRSHPHFGIHDINDDIEDLDTLLKSLHNNIILIGNSTGCQDILLYINKFNNKKIIKCFLQAPVSDTEYKEYPNIKNEYFNFNDVIYKKSRYDSLYQKYNIEDIFSSYLEINHFKNLNKFNYQLIFIISENDEYVIKSINKKLKYVPNSKIYIIKNGDHFLTAKKYQKLFLNFIKSEMKF